MMDGYITIPMVVLDGWVGHNDRYLKWWTWLRREASWTEKTVWFNRQQVYLQPRQVELSFLYDELLNALPDIEKDLGIKDMPFSMFLSLSKNEQGLSLDLFKDIRDNEVMAFIKAKHRNPSKYEPTEKDMMNCESICLKCEE